MKVQTDKGEREVEPDFTIGDWAVHTGFGGDADEGQVEAHYCGGGGHGKPAGWSVTHIPSGLALVHHLVARGLGIELAERAHQVCPPGTSPRECMLDLRGVAEVYGRVRGRKKQRNHGVSRMTP